MPPDSHRQRSSLARGAAKGPSTRDGPSAGTIVAASLLLLLLVGAGVWAYVLSRQSNVPVDMASLCPTGRPPSEVTVLLLDASDRIDEPQLLAIRNHLTRLQSSLPKFGLLEAYVVQSTGEQFARPLLHLCNPGDGRDMSVIYENPALAAKRWKSEFADRITVELDRLLTQPDSAASPIFEAVQAVSVGTFDKPEFDGVAKRLILFSDLLQNVPGKQSHYQRVPDFAEFRKTPYFDRVRSNLSDVQVDIFYLARAGSHTQGIDHIRFWENYFAVQGATVKSVERIYGDR